MGETDRLAGNRGPGDCHHSPHRGDTVLDVCPSHGRAIENRRGEAFELSAIEVSVGAENPCRFARRFVEDLDVARFVEPRIVGLPEDAAVLAVDLETLVPVHPDRNRQVEVAERATCEGDVDKPAKSAESLAAARVDLDDLAAKMTRRVHKMTAMRKHEISAKIGLRISGGSLRACALYDRRLHRVGELIAMRRIAIPGFQRQELTHLGLNERLGALDAGVEALHVADLEDSAGVLDDPPQVLDLLDRYAERLFTQHVLAGP